jgi:CBS domain-containing protein
MLAKDLMIPLVEFLTPEMSLKDAAKVLRTANRGEERTGVKGLPVLDPKGKMVGFLSIGDLLKAVFPPYMSLMNISELSWGSMVEDMAKKVADRQVGSIMTTEIITIPEEAPLMVCIDHMLKHGVKRLPVIAASGWIPGSGWVVGILYERDVFEAICDIMLSVTKEKLG